MCGIFGIIAKENENIVNNIICGLQQLEYRGYDSSGITVLNNNNFQTIKSIGKIKNLKEKVGEKLNSNIGISHTRWATHGGVSIENAHPHISSNEDIAIVHNGIIENYIELKKDLINKGFKFKGQTDSEVISNLISYELKIEKDIQKAFFKAIDMLEGSYGIAVIYKNENEKIFVAKNGSPLILGLCKDKMLVASSMTAFSGLTNKIIQLEDKEYAILENDNFQIFDKNKNKIYKTIEELKIDDLNVDKGNFEYFMLKEIYEQPDVLKRTIQEYIDIKNKEIIFPNFNFELKNIDFLTIVACGTSYHAGCIARYFIEEFADTFVNVDIASEFRYRINPLKNNGLALFISQSGETADTLAALKYCKEKNQKILSIVNVTQSAIANTSDVILKTMAGVEIGVASTKAFTAQVALLYLFAVKLAKEKGKISIEEYHKKIENFINSSLILENALNDTENINLIKNISREIKDSKHLIYLGRNIFYPIALEGALKIKEVSYIPTLGIASGELKHGPIALIDENTYIVIFNNSNLLFEKSASSIEEVSARKGKVILISDKECLNDKIYKFIKTPNTNNEFEIFLSALIPMQLLAYYVALEKELDIDKPRNIAKSVTVE